MSSVVEARGFEPLTSRVQPAVLAQMGPERKTRFYHASWAACFTILSASLFALSAAHHTIDDHDYF